MSEKVDSSLLPDLSAIIQVPKDLVFDDDPLEPMLYGGAAKSASPVDILALWQLGDRECIPVDALAAVLINQPELVRNIKQLDVIELHFWEELEAAQFKEACNRTADLLAALAAIFRAEGRFSNAIRLHRRALEIYRETDGSNHERAFKKCQSLVDLLKSAGREEEAAVVRRECEIDYLLLKGDQNSLFKLRNLAYDLYEKGDYRNAEAIYKRLLHEKFEVPGTLSHLARVLLAMPDRDNRKEARKTLEEAWSKRQYAPDYVPPRILFWLTVLNLLEDKDSAMTIGQLKYALQENKAGAFLLYTSIPVLERWRSGLSSIGYNFLTALAAALNSEKMLEAIETFPAWKNQSPVAFESSESGREIHPL